MSSPASPDPAASGARTRGRPPRLDRARTVEVALALLDEVGLDALTMRRLADAMDVQAGALYRYFATKQDLLAELADRMLAGCADPPSPGTGRAEHPDWPAQLTALAHRMRTALLRHRDGARVYAGTHSTGANTLGFADALVGTLRGAGFGAADAARSAYAIVHFTIGHTLEEQAALPHGAQQQPPDAERLRAAITPDRYPHLAAAEPVLTGSDYATHFAYGLRLIIDGLRAQAPARP
ncbi:TetR/AcrR family transcriptional regulator [Kitasatospora sp. NPDC088346]|uniref:TetR/AcrR family transcriptional regulator n=1 Tax=Kitasatospora sp. NPDC088346 TaxID=3364073 RepID=UPI003822A61A